jgi:thiol-disulfide isomerase/thioredoxin
MPDLEKLSKRAGSRLQVLGVNYDDNAEAAGALARELDITYDLAVDADKSLFREVEAFGMPTTLFVDEQGTIVFRRTGAMTAEEFRDAAREHLGVDV